MQINRPGKSISRSSRAIALLLLVATGADADDAIPEGISAQRDCGAYALGVMLRLLKEEPPPFETILSDAGVDERGATSMLRLAKALDRYGVHVEVVDVSETPPGHAAIAFLTPRASEAGAGHFVVVSPSEDRQFVLCSPPFWAMKSTWEELHPRLRGKLLLCSRAHAGRSAVAFGVLGAVLIAVGAFTLIARRRHAHSVLLLAVVLTACRSEEPVSPRGVRLDPDFIDLGLREPGKHTVLLTLVNDDAASRKIKSIDTTCTCALVNLKAGHVLAPGERRTAETEIKVGSDSSRTTLVSIVFEDGSRANSYIKIEGGPAKGIGMARRQSLGQVHVGVPKTFEVFADVGAAANVSRDEGGRVREVRWKVHGSSRVRLTKQRQEQVGKGESRLTAEFVLDPDLPGEAGATVSLRLGLMGVYCEVRWAAVLALEVEPTYLVLRSDGDRLGGNVTVRLRDGWSFLKWKSSDASVEVKSTTRAGVVSAEVSAPASFGNGKGIWQIWAVVLNRAKERVRVPVRVVAGLETMEPSK